MSVKLSLFAALASLALSANAQATEPPLLTAQQAEVDRTAVALLDDPTVIAAREAVGRRWAALRPGTLSDGRSALPGLLKEISLIATRGAAADPAKSSVIWTVAPAYSIDGLSVPSGRTGDSPDRTYRFASIDGRSRYVIHGKRRATPSLEEFSFEALEAPAIFGKPRGTLYSKDIDVAPDGRFTVTADSTPASGRRNHLQIFPSTTSLLIRDTIAEWGKQLPNEVRVERVDGPALTPRTQAEIVAEAGRATEAIGQINVQFLEFTWDVPANELKPRLRPASWGLVGSGLALNRFSIKPDEALVVTLDPLGARYLGFVLGDPWQRSVNYIDKTGSLNNRQAKPNADGSFTFVISSSDPGVQNWLDTGGLQDGVITIRWEGLPANVDIKKGAKSTRVVKLADLAAALPPGTAHVSKEERRQQLAARSEGYRARLTTRDESSAAK